MTQNIIKKVRSVKKFIYMDAQLRKHNGIYYSKVYLKCTVFIKSIGYSNEDSLQRCHMATKTKQLETQQDKITCPLKIKFSPVFILNLVFMRVFNTFN